MRARDASQSPCLIPQLLLLKVELIAVNYAEVV
jgi:hypothetical protein